MPDREMMYKIAECLPPTQFLGVQVPPKQEFVDLAAYFGEGRILEDTFILMAYHIGMTFENVTCLISVMTASV